jgi:hypothetical protein
MARERDCYSTLVDDVIHRPYHFWQSQHEKEEWGGRERERGEFVSTGEVDCVSRRSENLRILMKS